jgi:hypothetical protein
VFDCGKLTKECIEYFYRDIQDTLERDGYSAVKPTIAFL